MKRSCHWGFAIAMAMPAAAQVDFVPLFYLDQFGSVSEAAAITPDGSKIVGYSDRLLAPTLACEWTNLGSSLGIAELPGPQDSFANSAVAVSADGGVIVGTRSTDPTQQAFYSAAGSTQAIPLPDSPSQSFGWAVTGDGQVIVGQGKVGLETKAFRWDRSTAIAVYLPNHQPASLNPGGFALGISDDGRRIVGAGTTSLTTQAAVYWDHGGASKFLNGPGDTILAGIAIGISPDGSIIVGAGNNTVTGKAIGFRWTAATGVQELPNPTSGTHAIAAAQAISISGDGRTIVGFGTNVLGEEEAIYWVDGAPFRVIDTAFFGGVLPLNWTPFRAYGVDYFGNTIVGYGRAGSGKLEAYALVLDTTPASPPVVAPPAMPSYEAGALTISYATVPGLQYRVQGGGDPSSLTPLNAWSNGLGTLETFTADGATTGGADAYFLSVEVQGD